MFVVGAETMEHTKMKYLFKIKRFFYSMFDMEQQEEHSSIQGLSRYLKKECGDSHHFDVVDLRRKK